MSHRMLRIAIWLWIGLTAAGGARAFCCAKERGAIKNGSGVAKNWPTIQTSVEDISSYRPGPSQSGRRNAKPGFRFDGEKAFYEVSAYLIGFKLESDGDYHLVIEDDDSDDRMIAEIPEPSCISNPLVKDKVQQVRSFIKATFKHQPTSKFYTLTIPQKIQITGLGFYDFSHGQTGEAKNSFELHPVTNLCFKTKILSLDSKATDEVQFCAVLGD